jgi:hypothetical protein
MSSLSGQTGNAGQFNYAASKAALIAMTKSLAQEVGRKGVRVNAVAPGIIETKMIEDVAFLQEMKGNIPLRRFGQAEEVASAVAFLVSNEASYITGQTLSANNIICQVDISTALNVLVFGLILVPIMLEHLVKVYRFIKSSATWVYITQKIILNSVTNKLIPIFLMVGSILIPLVTMEIFVN